MRKYFFIFTLLFIMLSCDSKDKNLVDVSAVKVEFTIDRFDIDFYSTKEEMLLETKEKYPLFFPKNTPDSVWVNKIKNKDEQELFAETQKVFSNIDFLQNDLEQLFKHIKYYNPKFKAPNIITMLSNIDYENRVIYADSLLLISLDVYLGKKHKFYNDYPKYIKENNTKEHLIVDVANAIINKQILPLNNRSFLSKMIYEGKKLYLLEMYLPTISTKEKSSYSIESKF